MAAPDSVINDVLMVLFIYYFFTPPFLGFYLRMKIPVEFQLWRRKKINDSIYHIKSFVT